MKECFDGYFRNLKGICIKKCSDNQIRHPKTNRCRRKTIKCYRENMELVDGSCVNKCNFNQFRNPKTKRCYRIAAARSFLPTFLRPPRRTKKTKQDKNFYSQDLTNFRLKKKRTKCFLDNKEEINGICVKRCDANQVRNSITNRCRRVIKQPIPKNPINQVPVVPPPRLPPLQIKKEKEVKEEVKKAKNEGKEKETMANKIIDTFPNLPNATPFTMEKKKTNVFIYCTINEHETKRYSIHGIRRILSHVSIVTKILYSQIHKKRDD